MITKLWLLSFLREQCGTHCSRISLGRIRGIRSIRSIRAAYRIRRILRIQRISRISCSALCQLQCSLALIRQGYEGRMCHS
jgi:hypothetical protein